MDEMTTKPNIPAWLVPDEIDKTDIAMIGNPMRAIQRVRMSKDTGGFVIDLGEQTLATIPRMMIAPVLLYGSRALFTGDEQSPVCSTGYSDPSVKNEWEGRWDTRSGHTSPSGGELVLCARCPYSRFGSNSEWNPDHPDSKGPACKEKRVLFCVRVQQDLEGYGYASDIMRLVLPATSIKSVENMVVKSAASGIPFRGSVFEISAEIKSEGALKWAVLKGDFVGFIGQMSWQKSSEHRANILDLLNRYRIDDEPYSTTEATEGPF
jgi:hypothetical protein